MGGAFHTMILEPHKFEGNYPTVDASSRLTNKYKAAAEEHGKMILLDSDLEQLKGMKAVIDKNDLVQSIITGENVEYEVPAFGEIEESYGKVKQTSLTTTRNLL